MKITKEQMEWLSVQWSEFLERWGRDPNESEWSNIIWAEADEGSASPIAKEPAAAKNELISLAFRELRILASMRSEIDQKARDGNANLYNRSYNDGSF
jgi:hypothetical protein